MSGGYFDYHQYKISEIAEDIENWFKPGATDAGWSEQTITELKNAVNILRIAAVYAHRADWLFSGDDSEDSFHSRLQHDLSKINK
jgi:hypothetical protein